MIPVHYIGCFFSFNVKVAFLCPEEQNVPNNRGVTQLSESIPSQQPPAVVNVPKPVPLVQTNIPVNYFQGQGLKHPGKQEDVQQYQQPVRSTQSAATYHQANPHANVVPSNQSEPLHQHPVRSAHSAAPHIVPTDQSESLLATNHPSREIIPVFIGHSASAFRSVSGQRVASLGGTLLSASPEGDGQQHGRHPQSGIGQSSITHENGDSKPVSDNPVLSAQIAELNRQHEEAQRRLQTMLQQQQQSLRVRTEDSDRQASGPQSLSSDKLKQVRILIITPITGKGSFCPLQNSPYSIFFSQMSLVIFP